MPRRRSLRGIVEVDFNLVFPDDDLLGNGLDDAPLLFVREPGPTLVEVLCSQEYLFFRKLADLHNVKLGLSGRNLVIKLAESVGPRTILCAESVFVDHPGLIKIVKFFDFGIQFFAFGFENSEKLGLGMDLAIGSLQVQTDLFW